MPPLRRDTENAGGFSAAAFARWMDDNKLSLNTAADALGMTRRMMAHYRTGSRPVPRYIALACKGWEAEHHHD